MATPVMGLVMNFTDIQGVLQEKANWQLIRDDMIPDNRYLTDVLTEGKYPDRTVLDKFPASMEA